MRRWTYLAGVVLSTIAVQCASFESDSPAATDGGLDASEATSSADAGTDGSFSDGPLCAAPHALCDDFNRTGSPFDVSRWSAGFGEAGVLATPSFATSPALVVDIGATGAEYRLQKNIAGPLQSVRCSFKLYVENTGSSTAGIPFRVALAGPVSYSAYFSLRPKSDSRPASVVEDVAAAERVVEFFPIGTGTWLTLDLEAPALRLWLNGIEKPLDPADGGPVPGPFASATIELGFSLYAPIDVGWRAALDDVVCDIRR